MGKKLSLASSSFREVQKDREANPVSGNLLTLRATEMPIFYGWFVAEALNDSICYHD